MLWQSCWRWLQIAREASPMRRVFGPYVAHCICREFTFEESAKLRDAGARFLCTCSGRSLRCTVHLGLCSMLPKHEQHA